MHPGDGVEVSRDGESFAGVITEIDAVSIGGESRERLTVKRGDFGTLTYVVVGSEGVSVRPTSAPAPMVPSQPPAEPIMPAPVSTTAAVHPVSSAPPMGASQGGVPLNLTPAVAPAIATPPPPPPPPPPPAKPERIMVQSTSKPSRYHTRSDCGKVPADAKTRGVSDEDIDFFGLEQCAFCAKRDSQISWQEVIASIVPAQADAITSALAERGFRVSPEVVDREETVQEP